MGGNHVVTGTAAAGFAAYWTGRFRGHTPAVVRPRDMAEVARVLTLGTDAGIAVVPQGGNTGLLDVSVPAARWVRLASAAAGVVAGVDPGATVVTFGHVADGNVHVNIVPAQPADGRHEDAVFGLVASLGGSISAEHGIGALKARWLPLARSAGERALFARIRSALDPTATLNPHILPR